MLTPAVRFALVLALVLRVFLRTDGLSSIDSFLEGSLGGLLVEVFGLVEVEELRVDSNLILALRSW